MFRPTKKLPMVMQGELAECGLACIAMVLNYYGHTIDLNTLRTKYPISLEGANLGKLLNISSNLNLVARPLRLELDHMEKLQLPAILHWNMNHFVVLKEIKKKQFTIHDPSAGVVTRTIEEVGKAFTGIAVELTPSNTFEQKKEIINFEFKDLFSSFTGLKKDFVLLVIFSFVIMLFSLIYPLFMQIVVDNISGSSGRSVLNKVALGFLILVVCNAFVLWLRSYITLHLGYHLNYRLTISLFKHLIRLPVQFFERRHTADILSRFMSVLPIQTFLTEGTVMVVVEGIITISSLVLMFIYSSTLAAIVIFATCIYFFTRIVYVHFLKILQDESIMMSAKENGIFLETLKAIKTIKLFGNEVDREILWVNSFQKALNKKTLLSKYELIYDCLNQLIFGVENILAIYLGTILVLEKNLSIGMLFAFVTYKKQFTDKICLLINKSIEVKMLKVHMQRLGGIALTKRDDYYERDFSEDHFFKGSIEVENLFFRYDDSHPFILQDVNFKIMPGESVAIVGPSGCGKTTLLKIMMGLLKPTSGSVLFDRVDINSNEIFDYKKYIAAVLQDDNLFSGSIFNNICLFEKDASSARIEKCAKLALIHDDIQKKTMKYNTLVGDMGTTLSGGQKQRVLLARALYREPKILFLDEATSHLDSKAESEINSAVKHLRMTRVIIAHRADTIKSADRIIDLTAEFKPTPIMMVK